MRDFQRWWYFELLLRAWKNAEMPCHLRSDVSHLWMDAGASSEEFFRKHCAIVIERFRVVCIDEVDWIVQEDQLEIYTNQLASYKSHEIRGRKGGLTRAERAKASSAEAELKLGLHRTLSSLSSDVVSKERTYELNATECAKILNDSPGIGYVGTQAKFLYQDIIQKEHDVTGVSCQNITEVMLASRDEYLSIPLSERGFDWQCKSFFEQSIWKQPEKWRHSEGPKLSRKTQQGRDALASFKQSETRRAGGVDNGDSGSDGS